MDVRDRIVAAVDRVPAPPAGDARAVVERGRRRVRRRRVALGATACLVVATAVVGVASIVAGGTDRSPRIADMPDGRIWTDDVELGATYLWQGDGTVEQVALGFVEDVLGWEGARIAESPEPSAAPVAGPEMVIVAGPGGRPAELYLEPTDDGRDRWSVVDVSAGVEPPISVTGESVLYWRPSTEPNARHGVFEGVTGTAYVRTPEDGTVAIPLDEAAVDAAEVSLERVIETGASELCHRIQSTLLLFRDDAGRIVSAVGGVWYGDDPPDCSEGATSSDAAEDAEGASPDWTSDAEKVAWEDEYGPGAWAVGYFYPEGEDFTSDDLRARLEPWWIRVDGDVIDLGREGMLRASIAALTGPPPPATVALSWAGQRLELGTARLDGDVLVLDVAVLDVTAPGSTAGMAMREQFDAIALHHYPQAEAVCMLVDGQPSVWLHDMLTCPPLGSD